MELYCFFSLIFLFLRCKIYEESIGVEDIFIKIFLPVFRNNCN